MADEIENLEDTEEEKESGDEEPVEDERLTKRKKQTESRRQQAIVRAGLTLGIIVLVNIISINIFFRTDLTANRIYTLSDASRDIVGKLDDKLIVKAYFTDNLPSPYNNTRRYLKEILDDYRNYSHGNLQYEIISPSDEAKLEEDAQRYGIQPVQVQTFREERAEAMKAYMGLVFLYSGKQEILPFIGQTQNLEYEITGVIKRLSEKELKKVGILAGSSDLPGLDKIGKAQQFLSKYYNVTTVDASKNAPIPKDISVLIVFSPRQQQQQMMGMRQQQLPPVIPENLKFAVDQYIMNGGRVIFLLSKVSISSQQQFQFAQNVNTGVEDMLENYGIKINNDILIDKECAYVSVPIQSGGMQFYTQIPFPYYPKITNINRSIAAFANIGQVFLSFSSDIDTSAATIKGLNVQPLLTTSGKTGLNKDIAIIQASGTMLPDSFFKYSNLTVGSLFTGQYSSFYKGKPIPSDTSQGSGVPVTQIKEQSPETKIIVIGNSEFPLDEFRGPDENILFFSSMIDYMTDDVGLSQIRSKDATPQPLKPVADSMKKIIKYGLWAVPPGLVLLYGVFRWRKRKRFKS